MDLVVIGLGYVGLPLALSAANSGYKVFGFDTDEKKISDLQIGKVFSSDISTGNLIALQKSKQLILSSMLPDLNSKAIFVIAVPTPLDENRQPNLNYLNDACEKISQIAAEHSVIISESTSYIGTLRNYIKPLIDDKSGLKELKYAVAPERIDPGNKVWHLSNTPRIIGGIDEDSANTAAIFYQMFCDEVIIVSSPEVAEAAKLIENTFRHVNLALVNELTTSSIGLGFLMSEAISAAATKPFGFMPFFPGVGVGGHCIPVDPIYLSYSLAKIGLQSKLINEADRINLDTPLEIAKRIEVHLGNKLAGQKIQIVGITYKPDTSDLRESPSLVLISELRKLGAQVNWFDPLVSSVGEESSQPLDIYCDLGIIVMPHRGIDFSPWIKAKTNVIDLSTNKHSYGWPKFL